MSEPTDDQIASEIDAILAGGDAANVPAPPPPALDPTQPPPVVAAPPPVAAAPVTPPAPQLDDATAKSLARARQQQERNAAERRQFLAEKQQHDAALAEHAKWKQDLATAKSRGDMVAIARLHGIEPGREHAERVLGETLGKDAPRDLQVQNEIATLRREQDALKAEIARRDEDAKASQQRAAQEQIEAANRAHVRKEWAPKWGDNLAVARALLADDEFGEGIANAVLTRYRDLVQGDPDVLPEEAAKTANDSLERMMRAALKDPAVRARLIAATEAATPKPTQPTLPAEKQQPAPTIGQQHVSKTPPVVADEQAYLDLVRREVTEKYGIT